MGRNRRRLVAALGLVGLGLTGVVDAEAETPLVAEPLVHEQAGLCGAADLPETGIQGDVPLADQESGRAELGYNCGLSLVGHATLDADGRTPTGNANMAWAGDCAYVAGRGELFAEPQPLPGDGVAVVDVTDPANPVHVRTLRTPGALATSETLHAVETDDRSILVVGQYGNALPGATPMDVYDVTDCANPVLLETYTWPENTHNLTVSGNGRYVFATQPLQVADLAPLWDDDPATGVAYLGNLDSEVPAPLVAPNPVADLDDLLPDEVNGLSRSKYLAHEAWPSDDGTTLYVGGQLPTFEVLSILDLSAWLDRSGGAPAGPPLVISQRSGRAHSVRTGTIRGDDGAVERRILLHSEESVFGLAYGCLPEDLNPAAGAAQPWLTDITDPEDPEEVAQFGLAINDPANCGTQLESGTNSSVHYHDVDDPEDTTFVMASMWNAGVRLFDVRDPERPVEVAYFNPGDVQAGPGVVLDHAWGHIRWVPETGHVWFASADGGFWVLELQPQVRRHLDLDGDGDPPRHPGGAPGTGGVQLRTELAVDDRSWQLTCTLAPAQNLGGAAVADARVALTVAVAAAGA
jgi:hypothetical protein